MATALSTVASTSALTVAGLETATKEKEEDEKIHIIEDFASTQVGINLAMSIDISLGFLEDFSICNKPTFHGEPSLESGVDHLQS